VLPLRKSSELTQRAIVQFIVAASAGLTGEISRLLNEAAAMAILDGAERITLAHVEHLARALPNEHELFPEGLGRDAGTEFHRCR
jgi:hypothetical protein